MVTLYNNGNSILVPDEKAPYLESVGWSRQPEVKKAARPVLAQSEKEGSK